MENQTRLSRAIAVPTPAFALEVQCGLMPGRPGALSNMVVLVVGA
jgi:hypothetical protein